MKSDEEDKKQRLGMSSESVVENNSETFHPTILNTSNSLNLTESSRTLLLSSKFLSSATRLITNKRFDPQNAKAESNNKLSTTNRSDKVGRLKITFSKRDLYIKKFVKYIFLILLCSQILALSVCSDLNTTEKYNNSSIANKNHGLSINSKVLIGPSYENFVPNLNNELVKKFTKDPVYSFTNESNSIRFHYTNVKVPKKFYKKCCQKFDNKSRRFKTVKQISRKKIFAKRLKSVNKKRNKNLIQKDTKYNLNQEKDPTNLFKTINSDETKNNIDRISLKHDSRNKTIISKVDAYKNLARNKYLSWKYNISQINKNLAFIESGQRNRRKQRDIKGDGRRVSLLGLFELSTRWGKRPEGHSELAAARLAVKHVNERRILPGYYLHLLTNDTECDPGVGVDRFFHALYTQTSTRMIMLLGSACSEVTESLAKVVPYWNIVQVSFGSTSPALSDRSEFPLFYRTVAPDSSHNPARIAFIRRFGWDTVTALSQNEEIYSLAVNDLVTELEQANITCAATITFAETDFKEQLKLLSELDTRIIIGSFSHEMAPKIFCEAYELGMYGADYAWILQGPPMPSWWKNSTECPKSNLAMAVDKLILVSSHNSIIGEKMVSYSGLTNEMFTSEMKSMHVPLSRYAPQTYDAVWAIALALQGAEKTWAKTRALQFQAYFTRKLLSLNRREIEAKKGKNTTNYRYTTAVRSFKNQSPSTSLFTLGHFDYTRKDMAEEFLQQLGNLNFLGVSGPVSFSGADRIGTSAFYQVQDNDAHPIALYEPTIGQLNFTCSVCRKVSWLRGAPAARRLLKLRIETTAPAAVLAITSLAMIGIVLALTFLAINLHFRKIKSIKLSSPRLNNITIVGCVLVYAAVGLLGLDHATLPSIIEFSAVCTARVYLLSAGFSLAFGSMFAKTYRVHRIFIGNRSGVCKTKLLQDTQLISLICALLLIDGLIVTLWVVIDPMERHLKNLTIEISPTDKGVVYQPQVEVCRSQNTNGWLGALYVYKGLLLIVGVYMAWETRHVKITALNDSQYIGISVYSVVITSGIVVVLANIISERTTLAYVTITTLILISTTATLCLLFIPKLLAILKKEDNTDPIIKSMGLKLECNTRRFVTDDKRELQYRVEIQNKVYRREVAALDKEITRLEKLLDSNPNSSTSSSTSLTQHKRAELTVIQENMDRKLSKDEYARTPSISGGLPLLLLSVLPPVIPRASWPSTENTQLPMRRSVTFNSEPKLDENKTQPPIDLYNLCMLNKKSEENTGIIARIKNLFGSKPSSRKTSSASITGNSGTGIAAALKLHMGMIAGLVPGATKQNMVLSCNTLNTHESNKSLCKESFTHSGPIINILTDEIYTANDEENALNSSEQQILEDIILSKIVTDSEPKVNFQLPPIQQTSISHQSSQPILSFRDRIKGSPRFPHKIVPTCSLSTLDDCIKSNNINSNHPTCAHNIQTVNSRRSSHQPTLNKINAKPPIGTRWKSMEDATLTIPGSRRGSGLLAISYIPSNIYQPHQMKTYTSNPNCDVWSTADYGIPLSQLDVETEGQCMKYIKKETSENSFP